MNKTYCNFLNHNKIEIPCAGIGRAGGIFLFVSVLYILLSFTSCGLPSYSFLYPPELVYNRNNPETISDMDLVFKNAYENNTSVFSGYEIYYKIYDPLDDSDSDSATRYISERTQVANSTASGNSELIKLGFSRLFTSNTSDISSYTHSETRPAFPIDPELLDESFNIRLKFLQEEADGSSFYAEPWGTEFSFTSVPFLYRRVENESTLISENKFFDIDDFNIYDSDMPASIDSDSYDQSLSSGDYYIYISFFILSFGRNPDNITATVYSDPLYLGTLKFDCALEN